MQTLLLSFALFAAPLVAGFPQGTTSGGTAPSPSMPHSVVAATSTSQQASSADQQPSNDVMPSEEMVEEPAPFTQQSIASSMMKMITALAGILLLLVFVAWGVRRLQRGRFSQIQINRRIKILERRPLSPKSVLYLIEYDGKRVLIAESQLEVRPLTTPDGQQPPQAAD